MLATRVPLLGIAIAVGLLVIETLGAIAYHEYQLERVACEVAMQSQHGDAVSVACESSRPSSRR